MNINFDEYEKTQAGVWNNKLVREFESINRKILEVTGAKLELPMFDIFEGKSLWGQWCPGENRILRLNKKLFTDYEWGAPKEVLGHEMAHQVVSEIWKLDVRGVAHGEAWKKACDIIGCSKSRCCSSGTLAGFKGDHNDSLINKVRKLIDKGNCSAATESESQLFLKKAEEMMVSHNISLGEINGNTTEQFYVQRQVGSLHKKFPSYLWTLGRLVQDFYFVKYIRTHESVLIDGDWKSGKMITIFGEKSNVDVAEYVFHSLLAQGEQLWKAYKKEIDADRRKNPEDHMQWNGRAKRYDKASFLEGLFNSFTRKLLQDKMERKEKLNIEHDHEYMSHHNKLIHSTDKILSEMYDKEFPSRRNHRSSGSSGAAYGGGSSRSGSLSIRSGVRSGGSRGRLLT